MLKRLEWLVNEQRQAWMNHRMVFTSYDEYRDCCTEQNTRVLNGKRSTAMVAFTVSIVIAVVSTIVLVPVSKNSGAGWLTTILFLALVASAFTGLIAGGLLGGWNDYVADYYKIDREAWDYWVKNYRRTCWFQSINSADRAEVDAVLRNISDNTSVTVHSDNDMVTAALAGSTVVPAKKQETAVSAASDCSTVASDLIRWLDDPDTAYTHPEERTEAERELFTEDDWVNVILPRIRAKNASITSATSPSADHASDNTVASDNTATVSSGESVAVARLTDGFASVSMSIVINR